MFWLLLAPWRGLEPPIYRLGVHGVPFYCRLARYNYIPESPAITRTFRDILLNQSLLLLLFFNGHSDVRRQKCRCNPVLYIPNPELPVHNLL